MASTFAQSQIVRRASSNARIGRAMRFTIQRWAELADPGTHPARSYLAWLDPITVIAEMRRTCFELRDNPRFASDAYIRTMRDSHAVLASEPRLGDWYGDAHHEAMRAIRSQSKPPTHWPQDGSAAAGKKLKGETLRRYLLVGQRHMLTCELPDYLRLLTDETSGLEPKLRRQMMALMVHDRAEEAELRELSSALLRWGAIQLPEIRDQRRHVDQLSRSLATATSPSSARDRFLRATFRRSVNWNVCLVLRDVRSPQHLEGFGLRGVGDPPTWADGTQPVSTQLQQFVSRSKRPNEARAAVIASVQAHDQSGAVESAIRATQRYLDYLTANHRTSDFVLDERALTIRLDTNQIKPATIGPRPLHSSDVARPLGRTVHPDLDRSVHYNALARVETNPTVAALHAWIALEHLAYPALGHEPPAGPQGTSRLRAALPAIFCLVELRFLVLHSWQVVRDAATRDDTSARRWPQLAAWLSCREARFIGDLDRWSQLLAAWPSTGVRVPSRLGLHNTPAQAAAFARRLLEDADPWELHWMDDVGNLIRSADGIATMWSRTYARTQAHVTRLIALRNQTVHGAERGARRAETLAKVGTGLVDAVYETLPAWIEDCTPLEALAGLQIRFDERRQAYQGPQSVLVHADELVRP